MKTATPIKTQDRFYLSDLKNTITATWEKALIQEGFGRYSDKKQDVTDEIDSLLHYQKLMCFYDNGVTDLEDRERFIIDYASPFYTRESLQEVIVPRQSFIPRVVRNVAMLYKEPAIRKLVETVTEETDGIANEIEVESAGNAPYQAMLDDARVHVQAKRWHRLYTLCDAVAVRPVVRSVRGKARLQYDVLSPNNFRVAIDENNNIRKILYTSFLYDDTGGITEIIVVVWTDEEHYYRDADGQMKFFDAQPEGVNPYGMIPFVVMARDETQVFTGGMASLVESNLHVNFLKMLESEDSAFAAISIPFGVNLVGKKDEEMKFSPRTGVFIQSDVREATDPKLELLSGQPHGELLRKLAEQEEKTASMRHGMSSFMLSDTPQELSGKAMKIALTELRELRQDDAMVFEAYEKELFDMTRRVVAYESRFFPGLPKLPEKSKLWVDFADQDFGDDPMAAYELDRMLVQDNIKSYNDMFRTWNTDMDDEEEIEKAMLENKRINARMKLPERATASTAATAFNRQPVSPQNAPPTERPEEVRP